MASVANRIIDYENVLIVMIYSLWQAQRAAYFKEELKLYSPYEFIYYRFCYEMSSNIKTCIVRYVVELYLFYSKKTRRIIKERR